MTADSGLGLLQGLRSTVDLVRQHKLEKEQVDLQRKSLKLREDTLGFQLKKLQQELEGQGALGEAFTQRFLPHATQGQEGEFGPGTQAAETVGLLGQAIGAGATTPETAAGLLPAGVGPQAPEEAPTGRDLFDVPLERIVFHSFIEQGIPPAEAFRQTMRLKSTDRARTPFAALTDPNGPNMPPLEAFRALERARAEHRAGISLTTPEGFTVQIGGGPEAAASGAIKPLPGGRAEQLITRAQNTRETLRTIQTMQELLARDPTAFGTMASLKQGVGAAIAEVGSLFHTLAERNESSLAQTEIRGPEAQRLAASLLNPNTSRADFLYNTLLFGLARELNGAGRLTDQDVRAARQALSTRIRTTETILPALNQMSTRLIESYRDKEELAQSFKMTLQPLPDDLLKLGEKPALPSTMNAPAEEAIPEALPNAQRIEEIQQRLQQIQEQRQRLQRQGR